MLIQSSLHLRDAISKILQQAGKSAEEIEALATLDEADRSAEQQFSGAASNDTIIIMAKLKLVNFTLVPLLLPNK